MPRAVACPLRANSLGAGYLHFKYCHDLKRSGIYNNDFFANQEERISTPIRADAEIKKRLRATGTTF
jgi:hypothetical protein